MKFCICTIIKNEQDYLNEWITYHLNLGVDKIFIYEDKGSSSHKHITDNFDNAKVELKSCNDLKLINIEQRQVEYFFQIIQFIQSLHEFDWMFYIDIDEFITFEKNNATLQNIFANFNQYQIVKIFWQNYNANGHIKKPAGNVLDNYKETCDIIDRHKIVNSACKLAINLNSIDLTTMVFDQHRVYKGNWCNTEYSNDFDQITYKQIYIRHYITKSFEEYINKIFIRGQFFNSKRLDDFFELNPKLVSQKHKLCEKYSNIINNHIMPKILHYIRFDENKYAFTDKCIDSYKKYCSDYNILEWNAETIKQLQFTKNEKKFYKIYCDRKDYNAISDLIKLKVLNKFGGIFFDTNIELCDSIPDFIREQGILSIDDTTNNVISIIMGSHNKNKFTKALLDKFNTIISTTHIYDYNVNWSLNTLINSAITTCNIVIDAYRNFNFLNYIIYSNKYFYIKYKIYDKNF